MASPTYSVLKATAQRRQTERFAGKMRVVVQDGHCARAVGSGEVLEALRKRWRGKAEIVAAGCDGACYLAPHIRFELSNGGWVERERVTPEQARRMALPAKATSAGKIDPSLRSGNQQLQRRVLLADCGTADAESIDDYLARDGYAGLDKALAMSPEQVIDEVLRADLRGRGGAYFPAARKWQGARAVAKEPRYVVVNAEEGEPGAYKDRHLLEGDPHRLIEGLVIAGYASNAAKGFIYVNAEADLSAERIERAVAQAYEHGLLGKDVLGSGFAFEAEVRRGAGGYVCGEETTLLNTIEGKRRVPRLRPPFPTEAGLWKRPTVINNVETLCNVAWIMANGADAFMAIGKGSSGTKLVSLSGSVQWPGLVEVPMGMTLREIVYGIGGGALPGRRIVGVVAGGPSGGLLPESALDVAIGPGKLHESGAVLGSGGLVVLDDSISIAQVVRQLAAYNAAESCGKCTPCREGTPRMVEALDRLIGGKGSPNALDNLRYLVDVTGAASLCGLGQMAGGPILSGLHFWGAEFARLAGVPRQ